MSSDDAPMSEEAQMKLKHGAMKGGLSNAEVCIAFGIILPMFLFIVKCDPILLPGLKTGQ